MKPLIALATTTLLVVPIHADEKPREKAAQEVKLTPLCVQEQAALLTRRTSGSMLGTFSGFASLLHAMKQVVVHTDDAKLAEVPLHSPFPDFYKPTHTELFDTMARQMACSWSYDEKRAAGSLPDHRSRCLSL